MKILFFYLNKQQQLEGINLCSVRSKQLLDDATKLVTIGGNLSTALALYIFAVEEYGKGRLLQEFINTPLCLIDKEKFRNHEYKIKKGLDNLDSYCKKIELTVKLNVGSNRTMTVRNTKTEYKNQKTKYTLDEVISIPSNVSGTLETVGYEPVKEGIRWGCLYTDFDEINQEWLIETIPNRDDLVKAISIFARKF